MINYSIRETPAQRAKWAKSVEDMKVFQAAVFEAAAKAGVELDIKTDSNCLIVPCESADDVDAGRALDRIRAFWRAYQAQVKPSIKGIGGAFFATAEGKGACDDSGISGWRVVLRY